MATWDSSGSLPSAASGRDPHAGQGQHEAVRGAAQQQYRHPDGGRIRVAEHGGEDQREDRYGVPPTLPKTPRTR